jgi:dipeptidyl aminopeptidase/acylaminoacyl peptidase
VPQKSGWQVISWVLLMAIICSRAERLAAVAIGQEKKRLAAVQDSIQMTRLGDPSYLLGGSSKGRVAHFSPNGRQFIVVLTKGDLEQNTNRYSLLLFETSSVFSSPKPELLLTMSSSSNRPAIKDVQWLADNETIIFIGENPGESPQVYTFNVRTKHLERQTEQPTPITTFAATENGDEIIFEADPPAKTIVGTDQVRRNGIVVTNQTLNVLLAGDCYTFVPTFIEGEQLFLKAQGKPPFQVPLEDVATGSTRLSLSPNGRYALIEAFIRRVPQTWEGYKDRFIHEHVAEQREKGMASVLKRYSLLDVQNGQVVPLLGAPTDLDTNAFAWSPDGRSIAVSGAYLPLDVADPVERARRQKNVYVVEIRLRDGSVTKVTEKQLRVAQWNPDSNRILLDSADSRNNLPTEAYEKNGSDWKEIPVSSFAVPNVIEQVDLILREDSNTAPRIYAADKRTRREALLFDLNPEFEKLRLGKVEDVTWKATDGHSVVGGLYLPPDYVEGNRYPLVIQTHGFDRSKFWIDGPWGTAFAAQPLAAQGFVVLQVGGSEDQEILRKIVETTGEGPYQMAEYEGAIDYLDERGLIDRNHVGIIGFSRTVYAVEYTLTHSKYRFAAAAVADGINGGYFSYVVFPGGGDELLNGGSPVGDRLVHWLENSPGFNSDKVHTAVRMESHGFSGTVLNEWEWFSILSRQRKPVELVYLPYAGHVLVKPWERMTSQQGNVDWFRFWLKAEEDHDQAKQDQYSRWHHLRDLAQRERIGSANSAATN